MTTTAPLEWDDGQLGAHSHCGRYVIRADIVRGFVPVIHPPPRYPLWPVESEPEHVGPCFTTLAAAKSYCESDCLQGDE